MDWSKLISELVGNGCTQVEIGRETGLSQPAISDLLNGKTKDVRWSTGERLRALYANRVPGAPALGGEGGNPPSPPRPLTASGQGARSSVSLTVEPGSIVDPVASGAMVRAGVTGSAADREHA